MKKLQKKSMKLAEVGAWDLRKEALCNVEMHSEAASANVEALASYPKDLTKIVNEGGYTKP